jgi:hypothetical protein
MDLSPAEVDFISVLTFGCPLLALAANAVVQVLLLRFSQGAHFLRSMIGGFCGGGFALGVVELWLVPRMPGEEVFGGVVVHLLTYAALAYCYFNFVNLGQSSIRIRIYAEIAAAKGGLSVGELMRDYNETALMAMRLHRLTESGDLVFKNGRYFLGRRRLVPVARIIFAAKRFLLGRESEFPSSRGG